MAEKESKAEARDEKSGKEATEEKGDYRRREIRSSDFSGAMWLPVAVDADAAKAAFNDGVLEVTLPKTAAANGRNVPIE